jgi:hypothetical protein
MINLVEGERSQLFSRADQRDWVPKNDLASCVFGGSRAGRVSADDSELDANASKHRSVTYRRAGELVHQLKLEIADLPGRAETADGSGEEGHALPKAIVLPQPDLA